MIEMIVSGRTSIRRLGIALQTSWQRAARCKTEQKQVVELLLCQALFKIGSLLILLFIVLLIAIATRK